MKSLAEEQILALPLLDRLCDDEPDRPGDKALAIAQQLQLMREALRRDLEFLLNSRSRFLGLPAHCSALTPSLATFGMPDIAHEDAESGSFRAGLPARISAIIQAFEPRLRDVQISIAPPRSPTDCLLRFSIRAELMLREGLEPVVFQTSLEPVQRLVRVETDSL
jgi:type VI secretion system protein ImpF